MSLKIREFMKIVKNKINWKKVKDNDNLTEMICPDCMKNKFSFLLNYENN